MLNKQYIILITSILLCMCFCIVSAQSLILDQHFNGNCIDSSSYAHPTLGRYLTYQEGLTDWAAYYNGIDAYVTIDDHPNLTFSTGIQDINMTIELLVQPVNDGNTKGVLCKGDHTAYTYEYLTFIRGGGTVVARFKDNSTGGILTVETVDSIYTKSLYQGFYQIFVVKAATNNINDIDIYINSVKQDVTRTTVGSYTCMRDTYQHITEGVLYYSVYQYRYKGLIDTAKLYSVYYDNDMINASFQNLDLSSYSVVLFTNSINKQNLSLYKNGCYIGVYAYNENIYIQDDNDYTIVLHESIIDEFQHIENIESITNSNVTPFAYLLIIMVVIGLFIWIIRR